MEIQSSHSPPIGSTGYGLERKLIRHKKNGTNDDGSMLGSDGNSTNSENNNNNDDVDDDDFFSSQGSELARELLSYMTSNGFDGMDYSPMAMDMEDGMDSSELRRNQCRVCFELIELIRKTRQSKETKMAKEKENIPNGSEDRSFIRTNLLDYNNKKPRSPDENDIIICRENCLNIRDALGGIPSTTISQLATCLTKLITRRVETALLLPATQDSVANWEAMGMMNLTGMSLDENDDNDNNTVSSDNKNGNKTASKKSSSSAKSAMTISNLGLLAAQLYVELLGMKGAWGAGLVDVGGISAVSALVRRWCVECRGREPTAKVTKSGRKHGKKSKSNSKGMRSAAPASKRSKTGTQSSILNGTRRSCRIRASVSFMECDDDDDNDYDDEIETQTTSSDLQIFEEPDSNYLDYANEHGQLTDHGLIMSGLRLACAMGRAPLQVDFKNWASEARESFIDASSAALGAAAALMAGCKKCGGSNAKDVEIAEVTLASQEAVSSLETSLRLSLFPPKSSNDVVSPSPVLTLSSNRRHSLSSRQDAKSQEKISTIYLLRGLLPILYLRMELPYGQAGKEAAYETASSVLVQIITSISEEIQIASLKRTNLVRLSRSSKTPPGTNDSQTPKRGCSRKSIQFAITPGKSKTETNVSPIPNLMPPSLKKSITPKRARNSTPSHDGNGPLSERPNHHPILSLIMGMLQKLFTSKGLERADVRSRITQLGIRCLANLPSMEKKHVLLFLREMCESKISSHRLLGVEMIGETLCHNWFWKESRTSAKVGMMSTPYMDLGEVSRESVKKINRATTGDDALPLMLLTSIQGRLVDKSPAVRTRAAMSINEVLRRVGIGIENEKDAVDTKEGIDSATDTIVSAELIDVLCEIGPSLIESLRKRASTDDRATVRRASIMAWVRMLSLVKSGKKQFAVSCQDISTLCTLCNDSSVSTRKASSEALTTLIQVNYENEECAPQVSALELAWAHTVLPLVSDVEMTCAQKTVEFFSLLIVEPIVELARDTVEKLQSEGNSKYFVAWRILAKLSGCSKEAGGSRNGSSSLQLALQKLLVNVGKDCKSLSKNLFRAVYRICILSLGVDKHSSKETPMMLYGTEFEEDLFEQNMESMRIGAWFLLDALTSCLANSKGAKSSLENISLNQAVRTSSIDSSFLALSLNKLRELLSSKEVPAIKKSSLSATCRDCLRVTAKMGKFLSLEDATACFNDLSNDLESFAVSIDLIPANISALVTLTKRQCDDTENNVFGECTKWIKKMINCCEDQIKHFFSSLSKECLVNRNDEILLSRVLFTVGELSMIGFSLQEETKGTKRNKDMSTDDDPVRGLHIRPTKRMIEYVQLMLPTSMPLPSSSCNELTPTPSSVRAHAFIALGKLCLRDEDLAKESLNILARELHQDSKSDPAVQSNALMVMGDLCIRYTNLVDKYLPFMTTCLQAGERNFTEAGPTIASNANLKAKYGLIKKNAILLLSSLILQDYIKWRGFFVHRFLSAVADDDDEVSCLSRAVLCGPLLEKQPNLICNSFVESVFVFNCCKAHPIYIAASSNGDNGSSVSLDFEGSALFGSRGCVKRHEIYHMMLSTMSDMQKLEVTVRLTKEVLGGAVESRGDLHSVCKLPPQTIFSPGRADDVNRLPSTRIESAKNVLTDTLTILTSPEIKVGRKKETNFDPDEEIGPAKSDNQTLHKELLSTISRKHLMEIIIPILCNLKIILEGSRSPLLKDLMKYLGYIFRSFKTEVKEFLANDPTLLQELEYDTRQHEKKLKETTASQLQASKNEAIS